MSMSALEDTAPTFQRVAHRIVWATLATVDRRGRPRSRLVHPLWEWDGEQLVGWVGSIVTPMKTAHLERTPYASVNYWDPEHDVATAECRAELRLDDASCTELWEKFKREDPPLGYDGAEIGVPAWEAGPTSPAFGALRLDPWRVRVFPAIFGRSGGTEGAILTWSEVPS
jgi:general stress protein 26